MKGIWVRRVLAGAGVVIAAVIVGACGGSDISPEAACNQVADAVSNAGARCGVDAVALRKAFVDLAGGCDSIVDIRDIDELQNDCLPAIRIVDCKLLTSGMSWLPPACQGQLLK